MILAAAIGAKALPIVEVVVLASNEDQAIDRGGAADHPAARPDDCAAAAAFAGFGVEQAGEALVVDRSVVTDGELQPEIPVGAAGFQQQHAAGRIGGEAVGDDAAGGTRTDNDVVVA